MCPEEYRDLETQRMIKCQLYVRLGGMGGAAPSMETLDREMDQFFPMIYQLVDGSGKAPADDGWVGHLVNVAMVVYRLSQPSVRERFMVAVHYGLFATTKTNLNMDKEDLWTTSFAAVLNRVADPGREPIEDPENFLFKTAKHQFQSEIRRLNHERVTIQEAGALAAARMRRRLWLRQKGISDLVADVENELPRFIAYKLQQQDRSRRTRAIAEARTRGFKMVMEMLLQHPDRSLDACRIRVERIVDRVNRYAPQQLALVPSRTTFFRWTSELRHRIRHAAEHRAVFPYAHRVDSL